MHTPSKVNCIALFNRIIIADFCECIIYKFDFYITCSCNDNNKSQNGYTKLLNGLILQWGAKSISNITSTEQKVDVTNNGQLNDTQNMPDVVQKTISYVRCEKCGAYNSVNAEICFNCKSKLK